MREQTLTSRLVESLDATDHEGDGQDMPWLELAGNDQESKQHGDASRYQLGRTNEPLGIESVGDHSTDQVEHNTGRPSGPAPTSPINSADSVSSSACHARVTMSMRKPPTDASWENQYSR